MPLGFENDTLMDFEQCGTGSFNATDFDPDPLLMVKDQELTGSKESSWCRKSSGSSNGLSSSSYCRRLGSSRRSSTTFQLWSPRLRLRDERKRVLKLSLAKLRRIDDAESCLRRSVLLNNTLRRLQREARDEKTATVEQCSRLLHESSPIVRSLLSSEEMVETTETTPRAGIKRRRSSSSEEEPAPESLNELYLPPTPRMISSLEDEEEPLEAWQCVKRVAKSSGGNDVVGRNRPALRPCNSLTTSSTTSSNLSSTTQHSTNQNSSPLNGYSALSLVNSTAQQSYSCGQSSLFGELQSVVFHSLITSLES